MKPNELKLANFIDVIDALRCGFSAYRVGWKNEGVYICKSPVQVPRLDVMHVDGLLLKGIGGMTIAWTPTVEDATANDWVMIK